MKNLIEKMGLNEHSSKRKRSIKIEPFDTPKDMLVIDTHTALLTQIELLNKMSVESRMG